MSLRNDIGQLYAVVIQCDKNLVFNVLNIVLLLRNLCLVISAAQTQNNAK
jgi:hypothetical protein